jgi:hypothetical protein
MSAEFRFLMISAMYENGGNTTQRFLDGHPELFVYPFESQLGTRLVVDALSSVFPAKYRWPVFALDATPEQDYRAIIDEEAKVRSRTPQVSKFRHVEFDMSDDERCDIYSSLVATEGRSSGNNVAAFFRATFDAWRNFHRNPAQSIYVGYSPIVAVDGERILADLPLSHVLGVVRNPWSAYAETKRRPVPLSLQHYMVGWTLHQQQLLRLRTANPDRFHLLRYEDLIADARSTLADLGRRIGFGDSDQLGTPSWNGMPLEEVYPWGTIRRPTPDANRETARELSDRERSEVSAYAEPYLDALDYKSLI